MYHMCSLFAGCKTIFWFIFLIVYILLPSEVATNCFGHFSHAVNVN
jgi:hypothetical protein